MSKPIEAKTLIQLAQLRAQTSPERTIYRYLDQGEREGASLSYAELDLRARAIAATLQSRGLSGERILLLYPPGLDYITAFFGCLYAGAVAVPVYPPHPRRLDRLMSVAQDADAAAAMTVSALCDKLESALAAQPTWPSRIAWLSSDNIDTSAAALWNAPEVDGDTLAFLQYTSGSTSTPKGVMLTHANLLHNELLINGSFESSRDSIGVGWLPLYHDMGLIGNVLQPMYADFPIVLMSPIDFVQNPLRWLTAISKYRATHSGGPNFAYELCVRRTTPEQRAALDLSSWQVAFCGAERIDADVVARFADTFATSGFPKGAFFPCYGLAEASLIVTGSKAGKGAVVTQFAPDKLAKGVAEPTAQPQARALVGCGRPLPTQRVLVVDGETRVPCEPGRVGEIWVAGASVAQGYFRRPEQTQATFGARLRLDLADDRPQAFLRTGDLGFFHNGELFVTGRSKDLIIARGKNHSPEDVEREVYPLHPALRRGSAAAFSVDIDGEERLVIVQEVRRKAELDMTQLVKELKRVLFERHDLPLYAFVLIREGTIPKTSSGKIQRHAARNAYVEGALEVVDHFGPLPEAVPALPEAPQPEAPPPSAATPEPAAEPVQAAPEPQLTASEPPTPELLRALIVEFLAQRLKQDPALFADDEPLSSYGLDSLVAAELASRASEWVCREVSPVVVYDYPTLGALVPHLCGDEASVRLTLPEVESVEARCAVVGMACRFPGAHDLEAYWQLLEEGGNAIGDVPSDRFKGQDADVIARGPRRGGYIENPYHFDAAFFGISPREALDMDPQQRLLLEVSHEALEHAGISPQSLAGSRTGVFVGISTNDYAQLTGGPRTVEPARATGNAHSIAANRISFTFDLRGPSVAIDTACSSSLSALHLAAASLQNGDCELAIVGGVNLILDAAVSATLNEAGMLAPDGQCKTFDATADGYGRGEGCGVVILKLADAAERDGDHVHARILGSAVNQDGRTSSLTAPNGLAQVAVIEQALAAAKIGPDALQVIETHGTGTSLGDPIEFGALARLIALRPRETPCYLGAVKTNVGHLEAAAGMAGLIKTILALEHGQIPPNLHCQKVNPHIKLDGSGLALPVALTPWPSASASMRHASVSSFGFGGANAHVVLGYDPSESFSGGKRRRGRKTNQLDRTHHVLPLSGKSQDAVRALASKYSARLEGVNTTELAAVCAAAAGGRAHLRLRKAIVAKNAEAACKQLERVAAGELELQDTGATRAAGRKLAFLFTGQGAQYLGMARTLYATSSVFQHALQRCAALLEPQLGQSLLSLIYPTTDSEAAARTLADTRFAQPALFAIGYALAELWESFGVTPTHLAGHSLGEYVAACRAGVFSLEDALQLVAARGRLMSELPQGGAMLAVEADPAVLKGKVDVHVAALNAPRQLVLSGRSERLAALEQELARDGVEHKRLDVSCAFHSPLMQPMLADFRVAAERVHYQRPRLPLVSNVTGKLEAERFASAQYWIDHVLAPVQFQLSMQTLVSEGCELFVEIGPRPTLLALAQACATDDKLAFLPSLRARHDDWSVLLSSLATLYERGATIAWAAYDREFARPRVSAPSYAFQRKEYRREPVVTETLTAEVVAQIESNAVASSHANSLLDFFREQNAILASQLPAASTGGLRLPVLQAQVAPAHQRLAAGSQTSAHVVAEPVTVTVTAAAPANEQTVTSGRVVDLEQRVLRAIADVSAFAIDELDGAQAIIEDLGFDSLMLASLLQKLDRQLPGTLTPALRKQLIAQIGKRATIADLIATIGGGSAVETPVRAAPPRPARPSARPEREASVESLKDPSALDDTPEVRAIVERVRDAGDTNMFFRINDGIPTSTTSIDGRELINYSSYNYLGLNGHPDLNAAVHQALERYGTSASASRIISGEKPLHQELERELSQLLGTEDTIVYIGGYGANQTTISHLLGPNDLIVHDNLAHNSIIQGAIASGATRRPFPHNDAAALDTMLSKIRDRYRRVLVVIEGIYSQDGDIAALPDFVALREKHDVWLMVDEAHSIGVAGKTGGGVREHFGIDAKSVDLWMGTLSKSFASCGGYIAGSRDLVQYLKYTAPGFVYACGITPPNAASALAAIQVMKREPERVERLHAQSALFLRLAKARGLDTGFSAGTPIVPIIIGDSERTIEVSHGLYEQGINALPIVHPAVEEERARIRFFVTASHSDAQIRHTVDRVAALLKRSQKRAA